MKEYYRDMGNLNTKENIEQEKKENQCNVMKMIDVDCKLFFINYGVILL